MPRVDFARYVGSPLAFSLSVDLLPNILLQSGAVGAACAALSPVSSDAPVFEAGEPSGEVIIRVALYCCSGRGLFQALS
jgi:hypothetical protein